MTLEFVKMSGAGNDFILLDNRNARIVLTPEQVARLCHRQFGIGADGLMLLVPSVTGKADWAWRFYNSDGSDAAMCGNGARCFARYIQRVTGWTKPTVTFETAAGVAADLAADGLTAGAGLAAAFTGALTGAFTGAFAGTLAVEAGLGGSFLAGAFLVATNCLSLPRRAGQLGAARGGRERSSDGVNRQKSAVKAAPDRGRLPCAAAERAVFVPDGRTTPGSGGRDRKLVAEGSHAAELLEALTD